MAQNPGAPPEQRAQRGPGELGLSETLARAAAQHPLIEAARARVTAARGARRTAGTLPNPVLTYLVENLGGSGRSAATGLDRETQTYATLPLEPLFQRPPRVRRADEDVRAANADLARARQMVALGATRAFYRVAAAQVAVDAANEIRARVTRQDIFVDRIASAWLIRRYIDPEARFKFVAPQEQRGYRPKPTEFRFDMFEGEYTHEGDRCTFEMLLRRFGLDDPALAEIAEIVHDIDLKDGKFGREDAVGIERVLAGIAGASANDAARLERGAGLFDDLYALFISKGAR